MSQLVTYDNYDEILITTKENEETLLQQCFTEGTGRSLDDYNRQEHSTDHILQISNRLSIY